MRWIPSMGMLGWFKESGEKFGYGIRALPN
jgi:hypothetical protein